MDAFTVASEMLGGIELGSGQLAQLRAINYRFVREVARLLREPAGVGEDGAAPTQPRIASVRRDLAEREVAALRAMLVADIRELLTDEQLALLDRPRAR